MMMFIMNQLDKHHGQNVVHVIRSAGGTTVKVSREQAAKNRQHILDVAARLFRERGFGGVGVADLMHQAGFTHGGFYGHFSSKDDLMAQACQHACAEKMSLWGEERDIDAGQPLASVASHYLTPRHRDDPGTGCPLAALAVDVSRQGSPTQQAFTDGLQGLVELLMAKLPGKDQAAKRKEALSTWSTLVGAMVLSRAVNDPRLSDEILNAAAESRRDL